MTNQARSPVTTRQRIAQSLTGLGASYRRELRAYYATPMAYVFMAVFLLALGVFTWEAGLSLIHI